MAVSFHLILTCKANRYPDELTIDDIEADMTELLRDYAIEVRNLDYDGNYGDE